MPGKTVAILGTLDTKGAEYAFLRDRIRDAGAATLVIDAGTVGPPAFAPDVSAAAVAAAGARPLADLAAANDRGRAVAVMSAGAAAVARRLLDEGRIDGIVAMGGGGGTMIGTAAMRALPVGFPKLMVSTLASGDVSRYVDVKDITMMPSVVDIAGLNRLSRRIIANAAAAIAGMVLAPPPAAEAGDRPL
ncbi:MAG TPA: Tm-1-like ATP-binding domain-containing protein, partial [Bauldia sp.]|nr:Tm-1-like ATP-binding domain-containing protein [Bauldia sp.]